MNKACSNKNIHKENCLFAFYRKLGQKNNYRKGNLTAYQTVTQLRKFMQEKPWYELDFLKRKYLLAGSARNR